MTNGKWKTINGKCSLPLLSILSIKRNFDEREYFRIVLLNAFELQQVPVSASFARRKLATHCGPRVINAAVARLEI